MATKTATTITRKKTTKKASAKKPRMSASAARAEGAARTKAAKPAKTAKPTPAKQAKAPKADKPNHVSLINLAAAILADAKSPMNCKEIVAKAFEAGWTTTGKTPTGTLNAAIIREIAKKGDQSRFKKVGRGLFTAA